jgi:AbrB family looped-hinge helix DNA binding protein
MKNLKLGVSQSRISGINPVRVSMKSMKSHPDMKCASFSDAFYGTCTVGERGQIVIPAEARSELGFHPGEKIVIMRHPVHTGLMAFKLDAMREFLDDFSAGLARIQENEEGNK